MSRKERQRFERRPEKTYTKAELIARAERHIHAVRAGSHTGGRARWCNGKRAARLLVCLEFGIEYSPRRFRRLLKRLNREAAA